MGWISYILKALSFAPYVVHGIEALLPNATGDDKKAAAMKALGFADGVADTLDPKHKDAYDAAERTVSDAVDGIVDVMNAAKATKGVPINAPASNSLAPPTNSDNVHPNDVPAKINIPEAVMNAGREAAKAEEPAATPEIKPDGDILDAGLRATAGHPNNPSPV